MALLTHSTSLDCEAVRAQLEQHLMAASPEPITADLQAHLDVCAACSAYQEGFLAAQVLRKTEAPTPPEDLAENITSAARVYLRYQRRPIHQRALGSPAFLATCASLFCGAIICLLAIMQIATVPTDTSSLMPTLPLTVQSPASVATPSYPVWSWKTIFTHLPGGPHPASLVALYPKALTFMAIQTTQSADVETAPLHHPSTKSH